MWIRVLLRAIALVLTYIVMSSSAHAQMDAPLLWLAAGAHGAPCGAPDACIAAAGLACVGERCVEAGGAYQACRPIDHPSMTRCDVGLACDDSVCVPAGGRGQVCRACDSSSTLLSCLLDRCGSYLGCDPTSFTCEPAGGRNQPCRELEPLTSLPICDAQRVCIMGTCVDSGGAGQPCAADMSCGKGLFCEQTGSGGYGTCAIQPRGLVSAVTTAQATSCVPNVKGAFAELATRGGYNRTFSFDAHENERLRPDQAVVAEFDSDINYSIYPEDWDRDHVQGIVRLPGMNHRFLISRGANDGGPAGLMITDRSDALYLFPTDRAPSNTQHPGGLSIFGNTVAVATEHGRRQYEYCEPPLGGPVVPCERWDLDVGWVDLWTYDESNRTRPLTWQSQVNTSLLPGKGDRPSAVAYTRLPNGRGLMFLLGRVSGEGWLLEENEYGTFGLLQHFPDLYGSHMVTDSSLPFPFSQWLMYQNIHFITDCSGSLYLVASARDDDLLPSNRDNTVTLWQLRATSRGKFELAWVNAWAPKYDSDRCDLRYSGNPMVLGNALTYVCSGGLASVSSFNNIGVAEIWVQANPEVDSTTPIGRPCCEQKRDGSCAYYAPVNGACP